MESIELRDDLKRFASEVKNRLVPEPPDHVSNSPGEVADEPFGWKGVEVFCEQFETVLDDGITGDVGIAALGD